MDNGYKPVPVSVANAIADEFGKDAVVIAAVDLGYGQTHYTTFGRTPASKVEAANIADEMCRVMHGGVKSKTFEDFRHMDAANLKAQLDASRAELAKVAAERDKLKQFKEYVHARLDAAGVPADPDSPHKAEGCRIGGRLDMVLTRRPQTLTDERLEELMKPFPEVFSPIDAESFLTSANADPDEGAEWLPYYKLAVAMNAQTIGFLCGSIKKFQGRDFIPAHFWDTVLKVARTEFAASTVPCGVGPRTDVETWVKVLNKASAVAAGAADPLHAEQPREGGEG